MDPRIQIRIRIHIKMSMAPPNTGKSTLKKSKLYGKTFRKKEKKTFPHQKGGRAAGRAPGPESYSVHSSVQITTLKSAICKDLRRKKKQIFPHRKGGRAAGRAPGPESWCPGERRRWVGCCCCCPPRSLALGSGPGRRRSSRRCGALCRHLCCCSSGIHPPRVYAFRSSATLLWHSAGICV
jgi:hypothetical protein